MPANAPAANGFSLDAIAQGLIQENVLQKQYYDRLLTLKKQKRHGELVLEAENAEAIRKWLEETSTPDMVYFEDRRRDGDAPQQDQKIVDEKAQTAIDPLAMLQAQLREWYKASLNVLQEGIQLLDEPLMDYTTFLEVEADNEKPEIIRKLYQPLNHPVENKQPIFADSAVEGAIEVKEAKVPLAEKSKEVLPLASGKSETVPVSSHVAERHVGVAQPDISPDMIQKATPMEIREVSIEYHKLEEDRARALSAEKMLAQEDEKLHRMFAKIHHSLVVYENIVNRAGLSFAIVAPAVKQDNQDLLSFLVRQANEMKIRRETVQRYRYQASQTISRSDDRMSILSGFFENTMSHKAGQYEAVDTRMLLSGLIQRRPLPGDVVRRITEELLEDSHHNIMGRGFH